MSQYKGDKAHTVVKLYDIKRDDLINFIPWTEQNQTAAIPQLNQYNFQKYMHAPNHKKSSSSHKVESY